MAACLGKTWELVTITDGLRKEQYVSGQDQIRHSLWHILGLDNHDQDSTFTPQLRTNQLAFFHLIAVASHTP